MKNITKHMVLLAFLCASFTVLAQNNNVFLQRSYWKANPSVEQVKQSIAEGNSPTKLNKFGFDATVYALLENANDEVITYLLSKEGNPIEKLTHDGRTYLFWAAYKNNMSMVTYLLSKGAKTDVIDDKGYSILNFIAVTGGKNKDLYELIISKGENIKDTTQKGANALLLYAPNATNMEMIDYFVSKGLDLHSVDNTGNGIFNYAAQKGNKELLALLIEKGIPYKKANHEGGNAMLFATKGSRSGYNSVTFFQYLEHLGISPNVVTKTGTTPLHNIAYRNKDKSTFVYFIDKGVDVNQANKDGNTALLLAANRNSKEIIEMLASKTENINHQNKDGQTALTNAISNSPEVISYLLENGADASVVDTKGNHLGYYLIKSYSKKNSNDFEAKLKLLTKNGVAITTPQKNGNTLYHLAVAQHDISLLKRIATFNIPINAKNTKGLTALQQAAMTAKNDDILKLLLQLGAKKDIKTDFDETVYDLAQENEILKQKDLSFLK